MNHKNAILLCAIFLTGCGQGPPPSSDSADRPDSDTRIQVVCTTNIVQDLIRQIGGDHVSVSAIMDGPGIDPHTYTPSPKDTNKLRAAEVIAYSGLHLEGQLDDALESVKKFGTPVICVTDGIRTQQAERLITSSEGTADPHVWFDPELWASCGTWVASELSRIDPDHAAEYEANAATFDESMQDTLQSGRELIDQIPEDSRVLVTAHDAFSYFSRAFGFSVEAVQGISTDSEPGLRRINELINLLVEKRIAAVFTEHSVSDRNITALVAGCEAKGHALKIGGRLYSDTAGAAGTPEETLSGAVSHNIREIVAGLVTSNSVEHSATSESASE